MRKYDDLEKLKSKSKFVQDVMKPIQETFDTVEKALKDYNDSNSDFNLINRGIKNNGNI